MDSTTHKTIVVSAVMETDLVTYINVPIEVTDDQLWEYIRDGNICGSQLTEVEGFGSGDWRWQEPYETDFSDLHDDYSKEIKNYE